MLVGRVNCLWGGLGSVVVVVVFLGLMFECILRDFFLALRMKCLGYFIAGREFSMCLYSSSRCWGCICVVLLGRNQL